MTKTRTFKLGKGGRAEVPWVEEYTLADFNFNKEDFFEYLSSIQDSYDEILERLRPGEPHPLEFENQWDDPKYQSELRIFESGEAMERHHARHEPERKAPPMDKNYKALVYGSADDKKDAAERLKFTKIRNEQLEKAARYRALGQVTKARDAEQRAAQYDRELEDRQRQSYSFEREETEKAVDFGKTELDKAIKWNAEQIRENFDHIQALVQGFRAMSDSEHSYVITGQGDNLKLSKVRHPGIPANEIHARLALDDDGLLLKLSGNGVESREEPEQTPDKPEPKKAMADMTIRDYENYVEREEAKAQEKAQSNSNAIAAGMFGG